MSTLRIRCHSCPNGVEADRIHLFRAQCHACLSPEDACHPVFVVRSSKGLIRSVSMDYGNPIDIDGLRKNEPGSTLSIEPKDRALDEFRDAMRSADDA